MLLNVGAATNLLDSNNNILEGGAGRDDLRGGNGVDRLIGGGWYNLTEYPHSSLDKAKQVIENDKLKNKIKQNKSVKYINVD